MTPALPGVVGVLFPSGTTETQKGKAGSPLSVGGTGTAFPPKTLGPIWE